MVTFLFSYLPRYLINISLVKPRYIFLQIRHIGLHESCIFRVCSGHEEAKLSFLVSIDYTPKMCTFMGSNVFGHHPIVLKKYESC
jgi:hypothetical protein